MSLSSASLTEYSLPIRAEDRCADVGPRSPANDLDYAEAGPRLDSADREMRNKVRFSAMNLLARREHGFAELVTKLQQRFRGDLSGCEIEAVVQDLTDQGLQSDQRFAESFSRMRCLQGKGPIRVSCELKVKGINEAVLRSAVYEQELDWFDAAKCTYERKYQYQSLVDYRERAKRLRFMTYRGYTADQISYAMTASE
jgi:regulatory protein